MLVVQKFGGSSLADTSRIRRAAARIATLRQQGHQVVAVVSAQGENTDQLLDRIYDVSVLPPAREVDACLSAGENISAALVAMAVEAQGHPAVSLTGWQAGMRTDSAYGAARIKRVNPERIRAELDKKRIVMIGNNLKKDIAGANRQGLTSIWLDWSPRYFHTVEEPDWQPDYTIKTPAELIPLLHKLEEKL